MPRAAANRSNEPSPSKSIRWTPELDEMVARMLRDKISKVAIAQYLGIHRVQLLRRLSELEEQAKQAEQAEKPEPPRRGIHLEQFHRIRRGFHVPAHLEAEYFSLLKKGLSRDEARQKLKLPKNEETR